MALSLSSLLKIEPTSLTDRDAFDPILDLDTRLFIDPHLLKHVDIPEFLDSYEHLQAYFRDIAKLLAATEDVGDPFWRKADRMMKWPEVRGLCIGYASKGTSGSGIGPELRYRLLTTARAIIKAGRNDPEIFELVGLLENDFGPDRISDMTANVIRQDLAAFTKRVYAQLLEDGATPIAVDDNTELPINPFTGTPLLLVPQAILRDLPVALDWSGRDLVAAHNQELRDKVNTIISQSWKDVIDDHSKPALKELLLEHPDLIDDLVQVYASKEAQPYDFAHDRAGEYIWFPESQRAAREHPLALVLTATPTVDEVQQVVLLICERFTALVENNGLWNLFYDSNGRVKHESAIQLLFYGIADAYCHANDIMIARETNSGRGPVDFKFGTNMQNSVLVEVKKSTNTSALRKGVEKQLPEYMNAEGSKRAIYLVVDVGYTEAAKDNLNAVNAATNGTAIQIIHVNGNPKPSASKL
jgi:hypothetical protein